jgi:hypothetical protein
MTSALSVVAWLAEILGVSEKPSPDHHRRDRPGHVPVLGGRPLMFSTGLCL